MAMGFRTNCAQVTRARSTFGQRRDESRYDHRKVIPPAHKTTGKAGNWSNKYHDVNEPMKTFVPATHVAPAR